MSMDDSRNKPIIDIFLEEIASWGKIVVFVVAFTTILNQFIILNASVPTGSMEISIMTNDRVIASRLSYLFRDPARFDIIIFLFPDDETEVYVKRIIGLPGETVIIRDGLVFIDDSPTPLRDDFVFIPPTGNYGPFEVPSGSYFVLGDNRNNSEDSRFWENPFVRRQAILGRAIFRYWRCIGFLR